MWNSNDYKKWLSNRLTEIKASMDFSDYKIEVFSEQDFAKNRKLTPKTITVIVKFLQASMIYDVTKAQPIQMLVITEENSLSVSTTIMNKFAETYNNYVQQYAGKGDDPEDGSSYSAAIKHNYANPVVLSNFNLIGIGYRTVLYVNTTLFILEDAMDTGNSITWIRTVSGDTVRTSIKILSLTLAYTMDGDTQPFGGGFAKTVKNFSTLSMTITVPATINDFTEEVIALMTGLTKDATFKFSLSFGIGENNPQNGFPIEFKMNSATISTGINSIPSLQITFTV